MTNQTGRFLVAVGAIIEDPKTEKILLLERSKEKDFSGGIWEYTTGRMNQFEEPIEALRREIREEAGIEVEIVKPISIYHIFRGKRKAENELIGVIYWCKANSTNVRLSEEHTDLQWVIPKEAVKILQKPSMQADILAFIKEKNKK